MSPRLLTNTRRRVNDEKSRVRICRTADHVFQKFFVTGRVDYQIVPRCRRKFQLRRVDCNSLLAFFGKGVKQIGELEIFTGLVGNALNFVDNSLRQ